MLEAHLMEYNSQKDDLLMPEYGRNIQLLVQYAKTIEERDLRQTLVEQIIELMNQMNPQSANVEDYRVKLWKHIFQIANYELDVDTPLDKEPNRPDQELKPQQVEYPKTEARFRHYGNNVHLLIKKALEMEDEDKKEGLVAAIGAYMKLAYRTWNREHYVSDEIIKNDLQTLSEGKLKLKDNVPISNYGDSHRDKNNGGSNMRSKRRHPSGRGKDMKGRHKGGGGKRRK